MYATVNDYILWLFKQWWVYQIFLLGQQRFDNDTSCYEIMDASSCGN